MKEHVHCRPAHECLWDLVALGEVMLRFDPGESRISRTREFRVWEGGAEYNVARGLRRCFGLRTCIVTALTDNAIGRLIEDLILQGGVGQRHIRWLDYDGVGKRARNGLNFTERGYGVRGALGCSDRGHTAVSQLRRGDIDWNEIFQREAARWFHTGGVFAALSDTTADLAAEAISAAHQNGTVVSYDLNYRPSLWNCNGGPKRAREVNEILCSSVDVLFGNEEDFCVALGFEIKGRTQDFKNIDHEQYKEMLEQVALQYPNLKLVAVTLREVKTATRNKWGALCRSNGIAYQATNREDLEILDRVGGGDSFASGLIYGLLKKYDVQLALEYGAAHGALAMTTPGDSSMVTADEVEALTRGTTARVRR